MNKQEAIDLLGVAFDGTAGLNMRQRVALRNQVAKTINQIDEPEKATIPKFVAEWFSKNPINGWWRKIAQWEQAVTLEDKEVYEWYSNYNETKFMQAWIAYPNIEVDKERLYVINIGSKVGLSIYIRDSDKQLYPDAGDYSTTGDIRFAKKFTEEEIKKDFEWARQFAKEVE